MAGISPKPRNNGMTPLRNEHRKGGRVRRAVIAGAVALTLSAGGATAWALDRFVVQYVEISDAARRRTP
jgi:hypothetical protein